MIADDLFAGAGGWDLGAAALGIHARGIEIMPEARATRDAAGLETIHDDVWTFAPDGTADGLIASPPCQTFSSAGKGKGRRALDDVLRGIRDGYCHDLDHLRFLGAEVGDDRTALVLTPLHFALTGGYRWLAWEQVPAVLPVWEACAEVLRARGWDVWCGILNAERYGVPQTRKRAVLLASRYRGGVGEPPATHSRYYPRTPARLDAGVLPWVSMATALGWGLAAAYWLNDPALYRGPRGPVPAIEGETAEACAWVYDRPSPTVVGSFRPDVVAKPGYRKAGDPPRQKTPGSVRVTVAEAGVLQSFPAAYPWQGGSGKQYLQAGNAVPPLLAMHALAAATGIPLTQETAA